MIIRVQASPGWLWAAGWVAYAVVGLLTFGSLNASIMNGTCGVAGHPQCWIDPVGAFICGALWPVYWALHVSTRLFL